MLQRTTVRLEGALLERAKAAAAQQNTTLTSLIEEGLLLALARSATPVSRITVTLPVSTRGGGTMPGIDLSDSAGLLDLLEGRT